MASEIDEQGAYKSESFAAYSSHMNELLARALHAAAAGAKLSVESLRPTSQQAPAAPAVSADPMDAWARWDARPWPRWAVSGCMLATASRKHV